MTPFFRPECPDPFFWALPTLVGALGRVEPGIFRADLSLMILLMQAKLISNTWPMGVVVKIGYPGQRLLSKLLVGGATFQDVVDVSQRRIENLWFTRHLEKESIDAETVSNLIGQAIDSQSPFAVIRPGDPETRIVRHFLRERLEFKAFSPRLPKAYPAELFKIGETNVGIVPRTERTYDSFSLLYLNSVAQADLLIYFRWTTMLCSLGFVGHLPKASYQDFNPLAKRQKSVKKAKWLGHLRGKKVLVISPFSKSIRSQFDRKSEIALVSSILPDFTLDLLVPPVTFAGEGGGKNWTSELQKATDSLRSRDFDVVLIGAGSYGPSLAVSAKEMGKVAIHLGSDVQGLFGIYGQRQIDRSGSQAHLPGWVRPLDEETPRGAHLVEGGAYW